MRCRAVGFWHPDEHEYHWYLTNLRVIAYLLYPSYRLRWHIELIFKACKQSLNANIIESLLLASLVAHLNSHTILTISQEQLTPAQPLATSFQRAAQVAVTLANDFIASSFPVQFFDTVLNRL